MKPESSFHQGNTAADGQDHRGWFIGPFMDPSNPLAHTDGLEVKMAFHNSGAERTSTGGESPFTTLAILSQGDFELIFEDKLYRLRRPGDYLLWSPNIPHRTRSVQDSTVITVRWPLILP